MLSIKGAKGGDRVLVPLVNNIAQIYNKFAAQGKSSITLYQPAMNVFFANGNPDTLRPFVALLQVVQKDPTADLMEYAQEWGLLKNKDEEIHIDPSDVEGMVVDDTDMDLLDDTEFEDIRKQQKLQMTAKPTKGRLIRQNV